MIGLEHLRGPDGSQWTGMSPPQQRSQYPQQKKSQAPQSPFGPQQSVQTSMGNFPTLQAYQQQQDAFVQQHLKNQSQYNQGLQSGQSPQRVPVMEAWKQAGENIQSGQYQGNPFQTGNVDAIMGMFGQYGIQAPQGFRDQLLQNLGQQSAPPMYQPQPPMTFPGGPMQPPRTPEQQPVYKFHGSPRDGWPTVAPGYGDAIANPGVNIIHEYRPYDGDGDGIDDKYQLGPGQPPQMGYLGGPMQPPAPAQQPWQNDPGYQQWRQGIGTDMMARSPEAQAALERKLFAQYWSEQPTVGGQLMPLPIALSHRILNRLTDPATGLPYGQQPRDLVGDWGFGDYGPEPPRTPDQQRMDAMIRQQAEAAVMPPNPSDPWSYPLRPGHTRGPSGEQIMTREAREAEIRRMEQESGRTYVRPKAGVTNGGWLPPAKPKPGASISLNPEQAAAMKQYMASRQSGQAQPTPARTQGTPYRGRQR